MGSDDIFQTGCGTAIFYGWINHDWTIFLSNPAQKHGCGTDLNSDLLQIGSRLSAVDAERRKKEVEEDRAYFAWGGKTKAVSQPARQSRKQRERGD